MSGVRSPVGGVRFFTSPKRSDGSGAHPTSLFSGYLDSFPGKSDPGVELNNHLHLAPRLKMSEAIDLLPLCSFIVWTRTTVTSPFKKYANSLSKEAR